ncbi:4-coumarate--CoA ligase-like 5 [Acorus gramineus]|uniref:4-coumarate--CoA ligase-like 5 n=1 Tax=Acorus gramineus TaxID=55184 RepID=A0AAV9AR59_ACOGR|nr:4-coumarate--CoA ligase-like 5 [Acorus gramineus]
MDEDTKYHVTFMHGGYWKKVKSDFAQRSHYLTNNISESFNAWINKARLLPMIEIMDTIRVKIMERMDCRRVMGLNWKDKIVPRALKYIQSIIGDVAFLLSPLRLEIPVLSFSLLQIGAVLTPSNPLSSPSEISRQISLSRPKIAFATSSTAASLPPTSPSSSSTPTTSIRGTKDFHPCAFMEFYQV